MTTPRRWKPENQTAWQTWLRGVPELDARRGYTASDLDLIWSNWQTGEWMLLEAKCRKARLKPFQRFLFERLAELCKADPNFHGFHELTFEAESPEDGRIWLDGQEITRETLIAFLAFKWSGEI